MLLNYRNDLMKGTAFSNFCLLVFAFCLALSTSAQDLTVREIMREPSIAGMRPESERLSPDGKNVIFSWNAAGREPRNLYIVSTSGGEPRILVNAEENFDERPPQAESKLNYGLIVRDDFVKAREKNLFGFDFSPDSKHILFLQNTDIYILNLEINGAKPRRIVRTQGLESAARWLGNDSILYSSGGNYFVFNLRETSIIQVTREGNPAAFQTIFNVNASKDGKLIAYVLSDGSRQRTLFVPNYMDEFVQVPSVRRGLTEQKVLVSKTDGSLDKSFEIKLPRPEGAGYFRSLKWAADNKSLLVDRIDRDTKRRQLFYIYNVGSESEKVILVTEEQDEKWIAPLSGIIEPNPRDASQILFGSERDGFNHLYLAKLERAASEDAGFTSKVEIKQLTRGNWQVEWVKWIGAKTVIFNSTEENTAERQFYELSLDENLKTKIFNRQNGMRSNPQIAETDNQPILLYGFSKWNAPTELFTIQVCPRCRAMYEPRQLTKSAPQDFLNRQWSAPVFVDIPSRDGKKIKSKFYLPVDFDKKKKYPMAIFVHGAGYLQNTINGWNNYYREFMFNQMLTQKGYVVLDIDYRGSAGYGRDWRTDVHDFLGGRDYEDHLDAIDFMVKNYAVNPQKVGVYGGSYGGFMAGMLVMRAPDKITAAAALRPVFDWKNYFAANPNYTMERLGYPDKNPEAYRRSSPISYAENLRKPLLILHGLLDDNVHAQDSIQLIEKLMRLEKTEYFEAMLYPSENHGFMRPTSWADEYERIFRFFEKHLK